MLANSKTSLSRSVVKQKREQVHLGKFKSIGCREKVADGSCCPATLHSTLRLETDSYVGLSASSKCWPGVRHGINVPKCSGSHAEASRKVKTYELSIRFGWVFELACTQRMADNAL